MREICRGLAFPEGPIAMADGSVLLGELQRGTLSRVPPHGRIEGIAQCGGGPNGAALGPDGRVYVCNNGGLKWRVIGGFVRAVGAADQARIGSIQAVNLHTGAVDTLYDSCQGEPLKAPNDLLFDAHGGFYFTDLGKRGPRWMDRGAVYYAQPDGSAITEILHPLDTPNGIGLSPDGTRLYVAETLSAKVRYWDLTGPGQVQPPTADPFQQLQGNLSRKEIVPKRGAMCRNAFLSTCFLKRSTMRTLKLHFPDDALPTLDTFLKQTKEARVFRRAQAVRDVVKGHRLQTVSDTLHFTYTYCISC